VDQDEEAGLRAFALTVGIHGSASVVSPAWIERDSTRTPVVHVDASWREEERIGYRVTLDDGSCWLLYYVPALDLWSGIPDVGAVGGAASE
jgi:hypothetical protein